MDIIDKGRVNVFITYFKKKGQRYSFFETITSKSIDCYKDVFEYCKHVYEIGISFQTGKQKYKDWKYSELLENLSKKIYEYFNNDPNVLNNESNFDDLHEELCNEFIKISGKYGKEYTYGNAQKFVNMCFKYLACFGNYLDYSDLFSFCHMPIDSNILEKLHNCKIPKISKEDQTFKYDGQPWTKLNKDSYKKLVDAYRSIIRGENPDCSSLNFDFMNWSPRGITSPITFATTGKKAHVIKKFYK